MLYLPTTTAFLIHQSFRKDIWALGCVLYELLVLELPFKGMTLPDILHNIMFEEIGCIPKTYSGSIEILVRKMLHKKPSERPTASEILDEKRSLMASQNSFNNTAVDEKAIYRRQKVIVQKMDEQTWDTCMKEAEKNIVSSNYPMATGNDDTNPKRNILIR